MEIYDIIEAELIRLLPTLDVPIRTGNLLRSIKYRRTPTGFQVYLDESQAPYAEKVEDNNPY
jgi:hypothetical protein